MAKADLKIISTTQAKIDNSALSPKKKGQLIFTEDSYRLYVDLSNSSRVEITDLIRVDTDAQLLAITSPVNDKLYLVKSTKHLWMFSNNELTDLTVLGGATRIVISATQPNDQSENDFWLEVIS